MVEKHSMSLDKRAKLFDWCKAQKDMPGTYKELAVAASKAMGFPVTESSLGNHWVAVNGNRGFKTKVSKAKVADIEIRLSVVEKKLDILIENITRSGEDA